MKRRVFNFIGFYLHKNYCLMKKIAFVSVIAASIILYSCKKDSTAPSGCGYPPSTVVVPLSEQQAMQDSLTAHNIQAVRDSSGLFYSVNQPGSGNGVTDLCTSLAVYYKGSFFNGNIFDSTVNGQPAIFQLQQVIAGWQKGLQYVKKGGDITLYIPPSLAYGAKDVLNPRTGDTVIPANSYLVFHVAVIDVQ
jgi:FKBP-type peptidyl-prolyl cis-trans isomerase FkpA